MKSMILGMILTTCVGLNAALHPIICPRNSEGYSLIANEQKIEISKDATVLKTWPNPHESWDGHSQGTYIAHNPDFIKISFRNGYGINRNVNVEFTLDDSGVGFLSLSWDFCNNVNDEN